MLFTFAGLASAQEGERRVWQPVQDYFTIIAPEGEGRQKFTERVNPFVSYTSIGTDFGFLGPAEKEITWSPGQVCATLPPDPKGWAGMWHSLARLARLPEYGLDFMAPYGPEVQPGFQPKIVGVRVLASGQGTLKLEVKSTTQEVLWSAPFMVKSNNFTEQGAQLAAGTLRTAKLLNWTAEPGADLCVDSIGFDVAPPPVDFDMYVFAACYAKFSRCYCTATGLVRDRAHLEDEAFDSVPGTGFYCLATAAAASLEVVKPEYARATLRRAAEVVGKIPAPLGMLPHFVRRLPEGIRAHPGTEFSSVDTAIYYHSMLTAAQMLGETEVYARLLTAVRAIDFKALRLPTGHISHGLKPDGVTILQNGWREWGGETALVLMLQRIAVGRTAPELMDPTGKPYLGTGFIAEIQSLIYPQFDLPQPDAVTRINWRAARLALLAEQRDYFPRLLPDSRVAKFGLYGLSAGEGLFGVGYSVQGTQLPDQRLVHPHYLMMSACLEDDTGRIYGLLKQTESNGFFPPWGLPENIVAGGSEHLPMISSLNAGFEALGAYHLLMKSRARPDAIYTAAQASPELAEGVRVFYP